MDDLFDPRFCEQLGLSYDCAAPWPRSAFDQTGPLCESLAEFLYDPANCDPGYWCGCSSTDPALCFPANVTDNDGALTNTTSRWGGHFTTKDRNTQETIVLVGLFDGVENKCPQHYYCPGRSEPWRCVDLCEPKKVCADPGEMLPCPKGNYCPVGTVDPISCTGLEACEKEGLRRFKVGGAAGVIIFVLVLAINYLFVGRSILSRRARRAKLAKLAAKNRKNHDEDTHSDDEHQRSSSSSSQGLTQKAGEGMSRRRSTLTPPEMTIDIEFDQLSLTIPNVGSIMRGVSGKIGTFSCL